MALLKKLFLLVLFTSSFSSFAKYSEAMCILYKQQMQQYSDNKSTRSYRNAKRDFDKNCSNPPAENKPQEVAKQPVNTDNNVQSQELAEPTNETVNPLDNLVESDEFTNQQVVNTPEPVATIKQTAKPAPEPEQSKITVADSKQVKQVQEEPVVVTEKVPPPVKKSLPPPATSPEQPSSLMTPLFLIILILLIAGLVLYKLRMKKQAGEQTSKPTITPVPANSAEQAQPKVAVQSAAVKPVAPQAEPSETHIDQQAHVESDNDSRDEEISEPVEQEIDIDLSKPILKSEHEFKEPEVRTFDPDAPLPGQKPKVESHTRVEQQDTQATPVTQETTQVDEPKPIESSSELGEKDENSDINVKLAPEDEFDTSPPLQGNEPLPTLEEPSFSTSESDIEPNGEQAIDEDDEIAKALATLNNELEAEQQTDSPASDSEQISTTDDETNTSAASSDNPFANLSLDPTWDPNSKEKPRVEPKKKTPKSAELIAAEERAKQLKTDD